MAEEFAERYQGVWNGKNVSFKRVFSGRRFNDEECEKLCQGTTLEVTDLTGRSGNTYAARVALDNCEWNGNKYIGIKVMGFLNSIPKSICGHTFTDDERDQLAAGCKLWLEGLTSKKGNTFDTYVRWGEKEDGEIGLIFEFE